MFVQGHFLDEKLIKYLYPVAYALDPTVINLFLFNREA